MKRVMSVLGTLGIFIYPAALYFVIKHFQPGLLVKLAAVLKLYPAAVSAFFLARFSYSLVHPPTAIEKIARITDPQLSAAGVIYTRKVTLLWCAFFVLNIAASLYTTLFASMEAWALYNGLISYLLIGSLLAGEYCYRIFLRNQH